MHLNAGQVAVSERLRTAEEYYDGRIAPSEIKRIREECGLAGRPLHDALMERAGWPKIEYDGQLMMSQQDALLLGGKVTAPAGLDDHVVFRNAATCEICQTQVCVEVCSGEAIRPGEGAGRPLFDREKCVFCGACLWNCSAPGGNIEFLAGPGGLHSAEN